MHLRKEGRFSVPAASPAAPCPCPGRSQTRSEAGRAWLACGALQTPRSGSVAGSGEEQGVGGVESPAPPHPSLGLLTQPKGRKQTADTPPCQDPMELVPGVKSLADGL